ASQLTRTSPRTPAYVQGDESRYPVVRSRISSFSSTTRRRGIVFAFMVGMMETFGDHWRAGLRISVRGQQWTIVELTAFRDCDALRLSGAEGANRATIRTILLPFDRPSRLLS